MDGTTLVQGDAGGELAALVEALTDPRCRFDADRVPDGWKQVEVYTNGRSVVVRGRPDPEDEEHNCDAMGCGSVGLHVLHFVRLPEPAARVTLNQHP